MALRTIAVFDFDDTLVKGDSFFPFLCYVAGWPKTLLALTDTLTLYALRYAKNKNDPAIADYRTFVKSELLQRLLKGIPASQIQSGIERLRKWVKWNPPMRQALLDHHAEGHHIVVASGGLDLYLRELLKDLPVDALLCTNIGIENGKVTAIMTSGNCVRERKADMVAAYIKQHGPFEDSWGYGNYPHDVPMLSLVKNRILV